MSGHPATRESWRKIQEMYTWFKRHVRNPPGYEPPPTGFQSPLPVLAIAKENIDHNAIGEVKLVEILGTPATTGDTTPPTAIDPEQLRKVRNFVLPRIWEGSPLLIEYCAAPKSGGIWLVTKAFSAMRLKGQLVGAMSSGDSTWTMDNLVQLDGHYPVASASTTVTFANSFGDAAADNAVGIVEWNDEAKQWELPAVVCSG